MTELEHVLLLREAALDILEVEERSDKQGVILGALKFTLRCKLDAARDGVIEAIEERIAGAGDRVESAAAFREVIGELAVLPSAWDLRDWGDPPTDRATVIAEHRAHSAAARSSIDG